MADDDKEPPAPPPLPRRQPTWLPDQVWDQPMLRRNPSLYMSQDAFVPPPMEPPGGTPAGALDDEIAARFRDVERVSSELTSAITELRRALPVQTGREVGPGHNQGPPMSEGLDDVEHLIALLKEKGPTPAPADRVLIKEQAEKTLQTSSQITAWLKQAAVAGAMIGLHEVTKDLTAPLWQAVADKLAEFGHAVMAWLTLFI